jgi:hypothetical protein
MWYVRYDTLNDTYVKQFKEWHDADRFCAMIRRLYPEQKPIACRKT